MSGSVTRKIRVSNLYVTPWHADAATGHPLPDFLRLWRFEQYYRLSAEQLPCVLSREAVDPGRLGFDRWRHGAAVTAASMWLFRLPSGQVVAGLSIDATCGLIEAVDLLEDCYFAAVQIGPASLEEHAHAMVVRAGGDGSSERAFLPERHQIVFGARVDEDSEDLIQRLIYRADLDYRKEYSAIRYPAELNRRPGWLAAVGPYVSVVCGHSDFIENAVFTSAIQAVGAAAQLRAIRQAAYGDVAAFRALQGADGSTRDRRHQLERIADQLGDLELELSYSVEATADFGLLVPSLRAESFHLALYESMGLADKAATSARMLERLGAAISAELTAIESIERRADDNRRVRYAVAVGFVSAVAIPASLILAFLGINASQVNPAASMFSHRYLSAYLTVAAVIVLGVLLAVGLWAQQRREARHYRADDARRARWAPKPQLARRSAVLELADPAAAQRGGAAGEPAGGT